MQREVSLDRLGDYSDEALLRELSRVAQVLGKDTLTISDIDTHARCSYALLKKRFGGLCPALVKAGLASSPFHRNLSDKELLSELGRVWDKVLESEGRRPYCDDLPKYGCRYSRGSYQRRWGSWLKACEALLERSMDSILPASERNDSEPPQVPDSTRSVRTKRPIPLKLRYKVLKRDDFRCVRCGRLPATHRGVTLHVDHITAESAGGQTVMENLQALCADCNIGKGPAPDEVD